jgi:MFS family permease
MSVACAAVFLTALDQTVVVTALPQIVLDLQVPFNQLDRAAWIVSGYLLGYAIMMPLMGQVSDLYGRRRVLILCLGIFAFGSLLCGLAPVIGNSDVGTQLVSPLNMLGLNTDSPGLLYLVAARFVQAAGGGAVVPVAMAIAGDSYNWQRRAFALGLIGTVAEAGGVLGPLYGALIVQYSGWQMIFYLNLPLVAILLVLIWRYVPYSVQSSPYSKSSQGESSLHDQSSQGEGKPRPYYIRERRFARLISIQTSIDLVGAFLFGTSLTCLSLGLSQEAAQITPTTNATSTIQNNPWLLIASLLLFVLFLVYERAQERLARSPLILLSLFQRAMFSATSVLSFLVGATLIIAMADIPLFMATVLNHSTLDSGLALLRLTAMIPVGAILGGWLCTKLTCRWTAILGLLPMILGFWLMHLWPANVGWTEITIDTLITGLGFGLVIAPVSTTALNATSNEQMGMAASTITVLRVIGMILGLAALTSWGLGRLRALASHFRPPAHTQFGSAAYNKAYESFLLSIAHTIYTDIFLVAGILCVIAVLPAVLLQGRRHTHLSGQGNERENSEAHDTSSSHEQHSPSLYNT